MRRARRAGTARRHSQGQVRACPARRPAGPGSDRAAAPGRRRGPRAGGSGSTASIRRSHGGIRPSRTTSSRPGSGPPSMSSRPPREPSTRMASPWPTSSTLTRATPAGRLTTTAPAMTTTIARAMVANLGSRDAWSRARSAVRGRSGTGGSDTSVGLEWRRRHRRCTTAIAARVATAVAAASGPGSVTLANGQRRHRVDDRHHDPERDPARCRQDCSDERAVRRRARGTRRASRPARPPSRARPAARRRG